MSGRTRPDTIVELAAAAGVSSMIVLELARVVKPGGVLIVQFRSGLFGLVLKVLRGTAAEESGLRGGDVILKANGVEISEPAALQRAIRRAADRQVELVLMRKKKQMKLDLTW